MKSEVLTQGSLGNLQAAEKAREESLLWILSSIQRMKNLFTTTEKILEFLLSMLMDQRLWPSKNHQKLSRRIKIKQSNSRTHINIWP